MATDPRAARRLYILTALFVVLVPLQVTISVGGGPIRISLADPVLVAAIIVGGKELVIARRAWSRWHLALLLLLPANALLFALAGVPLDATALFAKVIGIIFLFGVYIVVTSVTAPSYPRLRSLALILALSVALQNLIVTAAYFSGVSTPWLNGQLRLSGTAQDPNAYGGLLVVAISILLPTIRTERRGLVRAAGVGALLTMSVSLLLTTSRSAWIAMVAALAVLAFLRFGTFLRVAVIGGVGALAITHYVATSSFIERQVLIAGRTHTITARVDIIEEALQVAADNPVLGIGIGEFARSYSEAIVHNTLVWSLTELGIVGLAIVIGFLATIAAWGIRNERAAPAERRGLMTGLLMAHVAMIGLAVGIEALYQRWWWVVMGLIAAARVSAFHATASPPVQTNAAPDQPERPTNRSSNPIEPTPLLPGPVPWR